MRDSLFARGRRAFLAASALAALSSTGCNFIAGEHDATTFFRVDPKASGKFFGWSEITISQDARDVEGASLQFARLELPADSPADDLTFMRNILAEVVILGEDGERIEAEPVAKKDEMPEGEPTVLLDLVFDGDLRHFFPDGHTIRIEWTGERNPEVEIPEGGLQVNVRIRVSVD